MLYAFHYDEVGHLESLANEPTRPAVRKNRPDLHIEILPEPTEMTEDWQVNRVDELTNRDHTEAGSLNQVSFNPHLSPVFVARRPRRRALLGFW